MKTTCQSAIDHEMNLKIITVSIGLWSVVIWQLVWIKRTKLKTDVLCHSLINWKVKADTTKKLKNSNNFKNVMVTDQSKWIIDNQFFFYCKITILSMITNQIDIYKKGCGSYVKHDANYSKNFSLTANQSKNSIKEQ